MRSMQGGSSQGVRALRAAGFVLALVVAVVAIDVVFEKAAAASAPSVAEDASSAFSALAAEGAGKPAVVGSSEGEGSGIESGSGDSARVSETFEKELFSVAGERGVRSANGGTTVGFMREGGAPDALESVASLLVEAGWTRVPSGSATCASFVKEGGDLRWAVVICVGFESETSVVVQCA